MTETSENVKTSFDSNSKNKSKILALKQWGIFLGIAIGSLFLVMLPFIIRGKYFTIDGYLISDGISQHSAFIEYMFKRGLFSGLGEYDYNVGLGADYTVSFAYYLMFDPVNLLLYILPRSNFLFSYSVLISVRFLICAIAMFVYLRNHKVKFSFTVIFSVAYMLSGFIVYSFTRHPCLSAGAMYMPLITLGLEKAIDKKQPYILVVFTFLTTISSFYMAYMVTVYAVVYAAVYYVMSVRNKGEKVTAKKFLLAFLRVAGYYLIGLLLASFMLLPVAYGYLNTARSSGKGLRLYSLKELVSTYGTFFAPYTGANYTPVMFNLFTVILGLVAAAKGRNRTFVIVFCVFAVGAFIPVFGYIMNLCNYANNRYSFIISFCAYALIALSLNDEKGVLNVKTFSFAVKGFTAIVSGLALLAVYYAVSLIDKSAHTVGFVFAVIGAIVFTAGILAGLFFLFRKKIGEFKLLKHITFKKLIICFCALALIYPFAFNIVYTEYFDNGTRYASQRSEAEKYVGSIGDDFVRLDYYSYLDWDGYNRPINNGGYKGTQQYNTVIPKVTEEFMRSNSVPVFNGTLGISGFNGRTALEALMCTKYYHKRNGDYVPVQFSPDENADDLYVTDDYVRFGTVFGQTLNSKAYYDLSAAERQYAMLTAVVTETSENIEYTSIEKSDIFYIKNRILSEDKELNIPIAGCENKELYLYYKLADCVDRELEITCGKTSVNQITWYTRKQFYDGITEYVIKLDSAGESINIKLKGDRVNAEEIRVFAFGNDDILSLIRAAAANPHLTETEFTPHGFSGKINSDGGTMLIQLPYSKGWKAAVDGKSTEIIDADSGLMAIEVDGGEHTVEFTYSTPWLNIGVIVTCLSAAAFAALITLGVIRYVLTRKSGAREEKEEIQEEVR